MTSRSGGITVFLAVTCLVLLAFVATIIDVTRYHIAIAQSERALYLTSQSILSYYDRTLKDHYGLFGLDFNTIVVDDVIESSLEGRKDSLSYSDFNIESTSDFKDTMKVKEQILSYMGYRMPGVLLEPVLEKLNLISKTAKTQRLLEEQKVVVERSEKIALDFENLREAIEGFSISQGQIKISGQQHYVKQLMFEEQQQYVIDLQQSIEKDELKDSRFDVTSFFGELQNREHDFLINVATLEEAFYHYKTKSEELSAAEVLLESFVEEEAIYWQQVNIGRIKQSRDVVKSTILGLIDRINHYRYFIDKEIKAFIAMLFVDDDALSIRYKNQEARLLIETMALDSESVVNDIKVFKEKIGLEEDSFIREAYLGSMAQLKELETELDMEAISLRTHNNLGLMEEVLVHNLSVLDAAQLEANQLIAICDNLNLLQQQKLYPLIFQLGELAILERTLYEPSEPDSRMIKVLIGEPVDNLPIYETGSHQWVSAAETFKGIISEYKTEIYFDYSGMHLEKDSGLIDQIGAGLDGLKSQLEMTQLLSAFGLEDLSLSEDRPSKQLSDSHIATSVINMGVFDGVQLEINQLPKEIGEHILINEYAMGMFSNYVAASQDDALTLTRYHKSSHFLTGEIEYIISGKESQQENVLAIISEIMMIRVLCNTIHIIGNSEKRIMINQLAQVVAGWWTAGVGAILIAGVIALLWATLESFVDLTLLLRGERVSFIKTVSTWYTGFNGGWQQLMAAGLEEVQKASDKMIDWVSEEMKIQLNEVSKSISALASDNLVNWWEESVQQVIEEVIWTQEASYDDLDNHIQEYLDNCIKNKMLGLEMPVALNRVSSFTSHAESALMAQISQAVMESVWSVNEEGKVSLSEAVSLKAEVLNYVKPVVEGIKETIIDEGKTVLNNEIENLTTQVSKEVENTIDRYTTLGKENLNGYLKESKKKLQTNNQEVDSEMKLSKFIPGLTYEDYCRLFLFAQPDKDVKILRMLDLIEANIRLMSGRESYTIMSHYIGVAIEADIEIKPLFVDFTDNYWDGGSLFKKKVGAAFEY